MASKEEIEAVEKLITENYDPSANGTGYWETGNFDDTFEMGERSGYADALLDIGSKLGMDLPEKEEMKLD